MDDSETSVTQTVTEQATPVGNVVQKNITTTVNTDTAEFAVRKVNQVIWFFVALIMILLAARILFLLLGANNTGIVSVIYQVSGVFIAPFIGIFESPSYERSFFDVASILGLIFYAVLGFIITSLISLFSKKTS